MARITWDATGERLFETGVKNAVLYVIDSEGKYSQACAWNGITSVSESPEGAEATPLYADDIKYLNLFSAEEFKATLEAYMYPKMFEQCDGSAEIAKGVTVGQQARKIFGLCYRTTIGNDVDGNDHGYKLHLIYGCMASPSEKGYQTINDSPEAITFSWEINTTPVNVTGKKPTATLIVDSTETDPDKLAALEDLLYGSSSKEAYLPLPDEIAELFASSTRATTTSTPKSE